MDLTKYCQICKSKVYKVCLTRQGIGVGSCAP